MEQLTSKPTYTIYISGYEPVSMSYTLYQTHSIQGSTNLIFNLTGIDIGTYGVYRVKCTTPELNIFDITTSISGNTVFISNPIINYTYYPKNKNDYITVDVLYRNGYKTTFGITLCTVAENILDKDLTLLNTQMLYYSGVYIPFFNFESNENIIYPVAYSTVLVQQQTSSAVIYLKTDPEIDTSVSETTFYGLSASNFINTENSERIVGV
jgi:hypothetical protein